MIQTQNKKSHLAIGFLLFGAPEGTRTPDLLVRSQSLYPAELRAHMLFPNTNDMIPHFLVFVKSFLEFFYPAGNFSISCQQKSQHIGVQRSGTTVTIVSFLISIILEYLPYLSQNQYLQYGCLLPQH